MSPVGNLVPEIASSQKDLENLFPFEYLLPNHHYKLTNIIVEKIVDDASNIVNLVY